MSSLSGCASGGQQGEVSILAAPEAPSAAQVKVVLDADPATASAGATAAPKGAANPFGVNRIEAPSTTPPAGERAQPAGRGAPDRPVDANAGEPARQPVDLMVAAHRLVDRLVEAGSRLVGEQTLPRSLLVWPIREIGTQRHTVATVQATQAASRRARSEFRGLAAATLESWAGGGGDWAIVAGLRWQPVEQEGPKAGLTSVDAAVRLAQGDAQLCGILIDRRTERVLTRFVQPVRAGSLNLSPSAFHRDLPVVPATSGSPLGPALCAPPPERGDAAVAPGRPGALPTVPALVQSLDLELGLQSYEAGQYGPAVAAFSRAVDLAGDADIEALAGLALALERARPRQAGEAWDRLADAMLDRGRVSFTGSVQPLLASFPERADSASSVADEARRQQAMRRARVIAEGEPVAVRLLRRATVATATRLGQRGQCAIVIGHQDESEQGQILRAPAYERAYALARWLAIAGGVDGWAFEIGNVPNAPGLIGAATSNIVDAWDRRVDIVPANCQTANASPGITAPGR